MENYFSFGRTVGVFWISLAMVLGLSYAKAENPLRNVNLSPFWQWRSAYECMQNTSIACANNDIKLGGVVDVNGTELANYCKGGCAEHTKIVLTCISTVHRHFWFANGLTISNLSQTITNGCATNTAFSTVGIKSSAMKSYQNLFMTLVSSLSTLFIITIFNK